MADGLYGVVDGQDHDPVDPVLAGYELPGAWGFVVREYLCACGYGGRRSRPLAVHSATVTEGLWQIRRTLYDSAPVTTRILPASVANQTGVATAVPSRLKVVRLRYLPVNCGGAGRGWPRPAGSAVGRRDGRLALMAASCLSAARGRCRGGGREVGLMLQFAECQVAADQAQQHRGSFGHGPLCPDVDRGLQQAVEGGDDEQGPVLVAHRPAIRSRRLLPAQG